MPLTFVTADVVALVIAASASVACACHLWLRAQGSPPRKLGWTLVVCMPVLGPLMYGCLYEGALAPDDDPERFPIDQGGVPPGGDSPRAGD